MTLFGFAEFQRHAISFANGQIRLTVFIAQRQSRRKGPHPDLMVGRIGGIGVDVRAPNQFKTGRFKRSDHIRFPQISPRACSTLIGFLSGCTVLHNPHNAARFEQSVGIVDRRIDLTKSRHIVQSPDVQHPVSRAFKISGNRTNR